MHEPTQAATAALAIDGGAPVRAKLLPYARQSIGETEVQAVVDALASDWLTTGPRVQEFERAFAATVGARHAVAVSSGTAALHVALAALELAPGDEVLVPALTFAASANAALYVGAKPVFVDVDPRTLLVDPRDVARKLSARTRALVAVDYAGQTCDYDVLVPLCASSGIELVSDACHALGAALGHRKVGTLAKLNAFSLHPAKHVTSAEGGVVTTHDDALARRMRTMRNHGIDTDLAQRERAGAHRYDLARIGWNYRLTDVQCALGRAQLARLPDFVARRAELAARYAERLAGHAFVRPLARRDGGGHAWHLYVVELELERLRVDRDEVFRALRAEGIGVQVHYRPVHTFTYYREQLGTRDGDCPVAEAAYARLLSLPLFPAMSDADQDDVLAALDKVLEAYRK
ncbi:MAG: UDP-4-amino-4,6-dideoxy-N-acetyl-beta-L-altrosamine transaminase [Planctomycetota bacterium]|nr:MAG: UDP-4-amino-4,6-dideoxy-N-acetyl-beta-L-altrosamine transaminase [Planctomycetota bacterium]